MVRIASACVLIALSSYQCVYALGLPELLKKISYTTEKTAFFTETKTAYFLKNPVVSKGTLEFTSPSTLIKRITHPKLLEQKVEAGVLTIRKKSGELKTISLDAQPELAIGVNVILWVLSGNFSALDDSFSITLTEDVNKWTIELVPKNAEFIDTIASVVLKGLDENVSLINIEYSNGNTVNTAIYGHQ